MKKRKNNLTFKKRLRKLFHGKGYESILFNNVLLFINTSLIFLVIVAFMYPESQVIKYIEFVFGSVFTVEYVLRFWISKNKVIHAFRLFSIIDIIVIFSLFSSVFMADLGFLRIIRTLQILRLFKISRYLRGHRGSKFIVRNKEISAGVLNLVVFLFFMTFLIYIFQVDINPGINNYLDAMYFTITTLTTTGFGDITPVGWSGKLLVILVMIFGITLFVHLARSMFKKPKIDYVCRNCGLSKHDLDAIHCKHCGATIKNDVYEYLD